MTMMELLGKNTSEIEAVLRELGQPAFRGRQIAAWIYRKGARSFDEMTDLPVGLRTELNQVGALRFPSVARRWDSRDGSTKFLLQMADGERIETVHLPYPDRLSVCVSSQAGCAMACAFCATGLGGFRRNLTTEEIIAQPLMAMADVATREARQQGNGARDVAASRPTHIVFMGMGEPLLNLTNVLKTIGLMHDEMQIPMRHITVSTVGIINGIRKLAEEQIQVTLAVSLHAADDDLRHRLIPTSLKTRVSDIIEASKYYFEKTGRRVTFEYVLLGGVNDSPDLAHKLARLCKGWPCHVNVIPWNAVPDATFESSSFTAPTSAAVREFKAILERAGIPITQRVQRGADVAAACGQLRAFDRDPQSTIALTPA
jgi:23S rRNA (adenine2503-C2)-methyltransferase